MWIDIASVEELKTKKKLRVEHEGKPILLTFYEDAFYAIDDRCPHLKASLFKGTFEKGIITCAKHHAQIDVKTGEIVENAKILFLKMPVKKATTFPVKTEGNRIFVDL